MFIIYIIFIGTLITLLFLLKRKIKERYYYSLDDLNNLEDDFKNLILEAKELKQENSKREEIVTDVMNLYELTKEICEFLEEDKIFPGFQKGLRKFIHFDECSHLINISSQSNLETFEIMPLVSDSDNYGYLAIKGIDKKDRLTLDILVAQLIASLKRVRLYRRVQELAITDSLTKAFTRRYSLERFKEELQRSQELKLSLSFLMVDIDNFKLFNDKYGHLVGDVILRNISEIIKLNCREIDLIGRFGGEEFMVILPMTSKDGALFAGERIRKAIESTQIKAFDESLSVTVSIGVSNFPQDADKMQELIDKADLALYRSKHTGKNKVSGFITNK